MTDIQIIDLMRNKKEDKAFLALYKHFSMIKKMIASKGGKTEDAEDVYQEALILLYKKVTETDFMLTSKLSTYLYSIARFLWQDELKKRKTYQMVEFDSNIDKEDEDSFNEMLAKENRIKLAEKIVAELGERCRELLLLFYSGKMKLKEIALKMGYSSENTAKNQKYKCIEAAKNKLKEAKHQL